MITIILCIFGFLVVGRSMGMAGFPMFDIINYIHPPMSDEELDKLIQPLPAKGYQYPSPSTAALNRVANCSQLYSMPEFPRTNALCLNLFQTTPQDIKQKIMTNPYDRIVLYGQNSVFDAPVSYDPRENYITDLYDAVKFMDLIAIPKFLAAYGLSDVGYVNVTKPYPYLYYRISSLEESDKICNRGDTMEKIQGCARSYYASVIPISAVGPQLSDARPVLRKTDKQRFSYLTHYPKDCYTNDIFTHETSHLLNAAGSSETGEKVMDSWFTEQVAGFFTIYGADVACGDGTVTMQKKSNTTDPVGALVAFNSVFPSAALSHSYPEDSTCRQALLTQWYKFLTEKQYRQNFTQFFQQQRATTPSLVNDTVFANFLVKLDPTSTAGDFLLSKGCSL